MPDISSLPTMQFPPTALSSGPGALHMRIVTATSLDTLGSNLSRPPPVSLSAAATINAGIHHNPYQQQQQRRRRSSVIHSLSLNDPSVPSPGELASANRRATARNFEIRGPPYPFGNSNPNRTPTLGELHQELENEQERQVNRLLQLIRFQQLQLLQVQQLAEGWGADPTLDDIPNENGQHPESTNPMLESPTSRSAVTPRVSSASVSGAANPVISRGSGSSDMPPNNLVTSQSSSSHSPTQAPRNSRRARASGKSSGSEAEGRDEVAIYQAETANLTRENQMLRLRIRELEKQLSDLNATPSYSPTMTSNLHSFGPVAPETE